MIFIICSFFYHCYFFFLLLGWRLFYPAFEQSYIFHLFLSLIYFHASILFNFFQFFSFLIFFSFYDVYFVFNFLIFSSFYDGTFSCPTVDKSYKEAVSWYNALVSKHEELSETADLAV